MRKGITNTLKAADCLGLGRERLFDAYGYYNSYSLSITDETFRKLGGTPPTPDMENFRVRNVRDNYHAQLTPFDGVRTTNGGEGIVLSILTHAVLVAIPSRRRIEWVDRVQTRRRRVGELQSVARTFGHDLCDVPEEGVKTYSYMGPQEHPFKNVYLVARGQDLVEAAS